MGSMVVMGYDDEWNGLLFISQSIGCPLSSSTLLKLCRSDYSLKHEDIMKRILGSPQSSRLVN